MVRYGSHEPLTRRDDMSLWNTIKDGFNSGYNSGVANDVKTCLPGTKAEAVFHGGVGTTAVVVAAWSVPETVGFWAVQAAIWPTALMAVVASVVVVGGVKYYLIKKS